MKKLTYEELITLSVEEQRLYLLGIMEAYPGVSMSDISHGLRTRTDFIRDLFSKLGLHLYSDKAGLDDKIISKNKKAFIGFMLSPNREEKKPEHVVAEEYATKQDLEKMIDTLDHDLQTTVAPDKPVESLKFIPFGEHSFKQIDLAIVHEVVDSIIGMTDGDVNTMKIRIEGGEELHFDIEKKRSKKESLSDWVKGVLTYIEYFNGQDIKVDLWFALS